MSVDVAGFEIVEGVLSAQEIIRLVTGLQRFHIAPHRGGIRRIETLVPEVDAIANSPHLIAIAQQHLTGWPRLVRAIYFDKSPEHNWFVTWHQDRTVAVSGRFEREGWGPWSKKAGAWHVQPPIEVLEQMIAIRVHLDPATADNGCLKIVASTHHLGLLASDKVRMYVDPKKIVHCETKAGGAIVMRPHVLHASDKSVSNSSRRVLHFEYSTFLLPEGIAWAN